MTASKQFRYPTQDQGTGKCLVAHKSSSSAEWGLWKRQKQAHSYEERSGDGKDNAANNQSQCKTIKSWHVTPDSLLLSFVKDFGLYLHGSA